MLDVHPPQHPAHTWTDFFIHIATIVIGLLIAIGLEQTVEYLHHRHEARHARELIADEMQANLKSVTQQRYTLAMHEDYLFADLAVIARARAHKLAPDDRVVLFHPYEMLNDSAWETAKASDALALIPYEETQRYAHLYAYQNEFDTTSQDSITSLQRVNTMFYRSAADRFNYAQAASATPRGSYSGAHGDAMARKAFEDQAPGAEKIARLTPLELDRLQQAVQQGIYEDEKLINRCYWLADGYRQMLK